MKYCQASLEYLQRVLERGDLKEIPEKRPFNPFSTFLANFKQHFNSAYYHYKNGCSFSFTYEPGELTADPVMVERALSNLIENAFKYAFSGTNIYLRHFITKENEIKYHCFDVTNYGSGITKEFSEQMFKRGVRGDMIQEGLGLGLWNSRYLAQQHGKGSGVEIVDGIIDKNKCISKYNANYFKYSYLPFKYSDKEKDKAERIKKFLQDESDSLKNTPINDIRINEVASDYGRDSVWASIFVHENSIDDWQKRKEQVQSKIVLSMSTIEALYDLPTYAITFRLRISQE
jgi:hypothetical protein